MLNSSEFARGAARQQNAVVREMSCGQTPKGGSAGGHGSAWKVSCRNWALFRDYESQGAIPIAASKGNAGSNWSLLRGVSRLAGGGFPWNGEGRRDFFPLSPARPHSPTMWSNALVRATPISPAAQNFLWLHCKFRPIRG